MDNVCLLDMEFVDYEVTMPWPQIRGSRITTATGLQIEFPEPGVQALVTVDGQASGWIPTRSLTAPGAGCGPSAAAAMKHARRRDLHLSTAALGSITVTPPGPAARWVSAPAPGWPSYPAYLQKTGLY
jgi:hypothetical protein